MSDNKNDNAYINKVNKLAMTMLSVMGVFTLIGYIWDSMSGNTPWYCTMIVMSLMVAALAIDVVAIIKTPAKFKIISIIGYSVFYGVGMILSKSDVLYVLAFLVTLVYILYFDIKLSRIISVIFISINIVDVGYVVLCLKTMHSGESIILTSVFVQMAAIILFMFIFVRSNTMSVSNNEAKLNNIKAEQEKSSKLLSDVMDIVKVVRTNSALVRDNMNVLGCDINATAIALKEISQGNESTVKSIEEQTRMTAKIQNMIEETKNKSEKMSVESDESGKAVEGGRQAMDQLIAQTAKTKDATDRVISSVESLIENADRITAQISEISSISNQTNLLALNASIESARAGEAGRGFAVVATEIGSLADQTRRLTEEIQNVMQILTNDATLAKQTVDNVQTASVEQMKLIESANDEFALIGSHMSSLSENIANVSSRIGEVYDSNNTIVDSISNVSAISEQVLANANEASTLGSKCSERAVEVNTLVNELEQSITSIEHYEEA